MSNKYPIAKVINIDHIHVIIICPYCNKTHNHGSIEGTIKYNQNRIAHCNSDDVKEYVLGVEEYLKKQKETVKS